MKKMVFLALLCLNLNLFAQESTTNSYVKLDTNMGDIYLQLNAEKAPITVENFLQYVKDGFYDGTVFHRVISNFMVQGGGFSPEMEQQQTRAPIKNEADNGLQNSRGSIAMARTNNPDSASSQFFINVVDNSALNHTGKTHSRAWGYTVFGEVVAGMDIVDQIKDVPVGTFGPYSNVPLQAVIINKATMTDKLPEVKTEAEPEEATAEES